MSVLTQRTWKDNTRDTNVMFVRTFAALFVSILIGTIFWQQDPTIPSDTGNIVNSILFLMTCFSLFSLPSISKYLEERLLYTREHASGFYSTLPYVVAHFIVEIPILLATCILYGTIAYWMVGFEPLIGHFVFFIVVIFVVIELGFGFGQILATIVDSVNSAIAIYVVVLLYSLLLGGFIISKDDMPSSLGWLMYTSYFYYGFVALVVNEFDQVTCGSPPTDCGQNVLNALQIGDESKWICAAALVILFVVLQVVQYLCLRLFVKEKK
jgi:ATP-binding cassette, subfamily G (WHITE), member 2